MKNILRIFLPAVIIACLNSLPAVSEEAPVVEVYTQADALKLGRAVNRQHITQIPLQQFISAESLDTGGDGISTAVMVDASVRNAIGRMLENRDFVIIEGSVISRLPDYGRDVYGFSWDEWGFNIVFSFERPGPLLTDVIEEVYGDDAYLYGELRRSYDDNYSLKVYQAENVIRPAEKEVEYIEAMISATVIGSRFQPLLGIRDGLGVLDQLGLAAAGLNMKTDSGYDEFREFEENGDKLYSFISSIRSMDGDFIDNLHESIKAIMQKLSEDENIQLPEQLFMRRKGDNTDFALFYYDILRRTGYPVKLVVIDSGQAGEGLYTTVFFRERDADLWGIIDGNILERGKADKWQRLPALVFSSSVNYFEPDIDRIFELRRIILPPPSKWHSSLY